MKCSICNEIKSDNEFNFRDIKKSIKYTHCKSCQAASRKKSYEKNRQYFLLYAKEHYPETKLLRQQVADFIIKYKTNKPCSDCHQTYPHYVLDFDHLPQHTKRFQIGKSGKYHSITELQKEIDKCEIVCSNCHRMRTWRRKQ